MSTYLGQADLTTDSFFIRRVTACVQKETGGWTDPPTKSVSEIAQEIMPEVASAPGFADKYLWGEQANGVLPGSSAIADTEILNKVQPMLEQFRPESSE